MKDQRLFDLEMLSLTDIIRLQNQLSEVISRRFEKSCAVVFSDIVESTRYFAKFGDEAGRRLQQQHFDLVTEALRGTGGQALDAIGDGILLAFPYVESAIDMMVKFRQAHWSLTCRLPMDQQWTTRGAIHWGRVLTDGTMIAGDTVNLCSKIVTTARPGAILVS